MQLIYARPFGFYDLALTAILKLHAPTIPVTGIIGALVCREDLYLQFLEQPSDAVNQTYSRILKDERHIDFDMLINTDVDCRLVQTGRCVTIRLARGC